MLNEVFGFYEAEHYFNDVRIDYIKMLRTTEKHLLVKAHEKEIYRLGDNLITAKIHRDNNGTYPFSKLDYLSHKIQELIYPELVPKLYAADFTEKDTPIFVLEKIPLDKYHIAFNISRQIAHQKDGLDYKFNADFLKLDSSESIEELANRHISMVEDMKRQYAGLLNEKGIAFDYSYVNITWRNSLPVALEVHKCQRNYLFDFDRCYHYFSELEKDQDKRKIAFALLDRISELCTKRER